MAWGEQSQTQEPTVRRGRTPENEAEAQSPSQSFLVSTPSINLPKGGGAIRSIGEKFSTNPVTGTGSMTVPVAISPGRAGFSPQLALTYDSGAGNGMFGLGWNLSLPSVTRKTDKGLPRYLDAKESDVFILAGMEDLVPVLDAAGNRRTPETFTAYGTNYLVRRYMPRVEGSFALIERWVQDAEPANSFWRTISRDNTTALYGCTADSRIADPADPSRVFQWLICETYDDKGNAIVYRYVSEDDRRVATDRTCERNRLGDHRKANRYPKSILYGNLKPYFPTLAVDGDRWEGPDSVSDQSWMFEVVFDYGDHQQLIPTPVPDTPWEIRADPFSSHRSGFEIRTYRLCKRVLMFHHFPGIARVGKDCVVRSTDFDYSEPDDLADPEKPGYTVLRSVTHRAYQRKAQVADGYEDPREFPPVTLTYSEPRVSRLVQTLAPEQLENLPVGTQGPGYQWVDLDGEGLSGVLTEQATAWYYKPNLGDGRFGSLRVVAHKPAMAALASGRQQLIDLAGDGEMDLVDFGGPTPGFHERAHDETWTHFRPFESLPNIEWSDPNLRFVDLTGDGHADALISEDEVFTWYPSLDERGFSAAKRTPQTHDEDLGPRLIFADGTQTIFLADMCGDGLTDLVRIRNGEICYWPNIGYGQFGRKVTFENSPLFEYSDLYDPLRIRLADIDGGGTVDVIYLGREGAQLYFNRSGNSFSDRFVVELPVATENLGAVQVADLLGNSTACLVWNSHLPADAPHPVRYIDLMSGDRDSARAAKPHLLVQVENNLGGVTEIEYTPSTRFYINDKLAGTPWITRLPFPVHCVSKVTVRDKWRGTAFTSTYSYHHGYFDGSEREFRGFGRVEQTDVEHYGKFLQGNVASPFITSDKNLYQPPVRTITWYHTGAAVDRERILTQFATEYFPARFTLQGNFQERALPEPELPNDLSVDEWREALRACKGMVLRQEIYELDVDDLITSPHLATLVRLYSAATHNCQIERLQTRGENRHSVFLVTESEALSYQYELSLPKSGGAVEPDPRVTHTFNLRHDRYGNPQQSIAVAYARYGTQAPVLLPGTHPRAGLIAAVQSEMHVAYTETRYTSDAVIRATRPAPQQGPVRHQRLRLACETRTYEIMRLRKPPSGYFDIGELRRHALCEDGLYPPLAIRPGQVVPMSPLEYHQQPPAVTMFAPAAPAPYRRLVENVRTLFFKDEDNVVQPRDSHPLGMHGPRGLKYEDYKLALTDNLLDAVFKLRDPVTGDVVEDKLDLALETAGPAVRGLLDDPAVSGYVRSSLVDNSPGRYWIRSGVAGFATNAADHFYLPEEFRDPFGNLSTLSYDLRDLFVESTTDPRGNTAIVRQFDYRTLSPREIEDPNGNRTEVIFDILGRVVASATKGKRKGGTWQGDDLGGFTDALTNLSEIAVQSFCAAPTVNETIALNWLDKASGRCVYHFGELRDPLTSRVIAWADRMPGACTISREQHAGQLGPGEQSPLQVSLECSDGAGNVLMEKIQAEPAITNGPPRWLINGLTVLNNKGKPVKQYEPAFSDRFGCQLPSANGVTPLMFYDAAGRQVRTEFPDGSLTRTEFSPWHVKTYDQNDTVLESAWHVQRSTAGTSFEEQTADRLAVKHSNTPALTILDSLGREVISIAHNRQPDDSPSLSNTPLLDRPWLDSFAVTFTKLDAEGKPLWIRDALGKLVMQYITPPKSNVDPSDSIPADIAPCYDIAGNLLFQHSVDSGDRWMLADAAGKPMLAWDFNDRTTDIGTVVAERRLFHIRYDALHRPIEQWLRINSDNRALIEAFEYVDVNTFKNTAGVIDQTALVAASDNNLVGQVTKHYDPSGLATIERLEFKGLVEEATRRLINAVDEPVIDWDIANRSQALETEVFRLITKYDAMGRPTTVFNWHVDNLPNGAQRIAVYVPSYNERGLLRSEKLHVRAGKQMQNGRLVPRIATDTRTVDAIRHVRWNEKGQKTKLQLGNGTTTNYTYSPETFRLTRIQTPGVQDLRYTSDPVGNITHIQDDAQSTIFFNNQQIDSRHDYVYDAFYRLIEATGRENAAAVAPPPHPEGPWSTGSFPSPDATHPFRQRYRYDEVGNFLRVQHSAPGFPGGKSSSWTRSYTIAADSNRLVETVYGTNTNSVTYRYDPHGNMLNLENTAPGLDIRWDWRNMVRALDLQGGGNAYYNYDMEKKRTRKFIVRNGGGTEDRIYLGAYELYRRRNSQNEVVEEIESLHVSIDENRVLLVDDVIRARQSAQPGPNGLHVKEQTLFRYQYGNAIGSVAAELDEAARVISYEEFHPYGTTAFRLLDSAKQVPLKRYRYTRMEKDEESGLGYHDARYFVPILGRWLSVDPAGAREGPNLYLYAEGNPLKFIDSSGRGGVYVEDSSIKPQTRGALDAANWLYTEEVAFTFTDPETGKVYRNLRLDFAIRDPSGPASEGAQFGAETKGKTISSPREGQARFLELLEAGVEVEVEITSRKQSTVGYVKGDRVFFQLGKNFVIIYEGNIGDFKAAVQQVSRVTKPTLLQHIGGKTETTTFSSEQALLEHLAKSGSKEAQGVLAQRGKPPGPGGYISPEGTAMIFGLALVGYSLLQTYRDLDAAADRAIAEDNPDIYLEALNETTAAWGGGLGVSIVWGEAGGALGRWAGLGRGGTIGAGLVVGFVTALIGGYMNKRAAIEEIKREKRARRDPEFARKWSQWRDLPIGGFPY